MGNHNITLCNNMWVLNISYVPISNVPTPNSMYTRFFHLITTKTQLPSLNLNPGFNSFWANSSHDNYWHLQDPGCWYVGVIDLSAAEGGER